MKERLLRRRFVGGQKVSVLGKKLAADEYLILATNTAGSEALRLYRRRWEIETLFAALKSRGFDLESTHVTRPERIRTLIGLLALSFAWSHLIGQWRTQREGRPTLKKHGRPERSLFRYGLNHLQPVMLNVAAKQEVLRRCLHVLINPSQFLSCT